MAKVQPMLLCACAEHYVASYLSGMGLVVALTRMGTPATDLFVMSSISGQSIALQVKTGGSHSHNVYKKEPEKKNYFMWRVGDKVSELSNKPYWYAFVFVGGWPNSGGCPEVFFVPSNFVAERVHENKDNGWFYMYDMEAEAYRGLHGYEKLKKAIGEA